MIKRIYPKGQVIFLEFSLFTISNIIYSLEGMVNKIPRIKAGIEPKFTNILQLNTGNSTRILKKVKAL